MSVLTQDCIATEVRKEQGRKKRARQTDVHAYTQKISLTRSLAHSHAEKIQAVHTRSQKLETSKVKACVFALLSTQLLAGRQIHMVCCKRCFGNNKRKKMKENMLSRQMDIYVHMVDVRINKSTQDDVGIRTPHTYTYVYTDVERLGFRS